MTRRSPSIRNGRRLAARRLGRGCWGPLGALHHRPSPTDGRGAAVRPPRAGRVVQVVENIRARLLLFRHNLAHPREAVVREAARLRRVGCAADPSNNQQGGAGCEPSHNNSPVIAHFAPPQCPSLPWCRGRSVSSALFNDCIRPRRSRAPAASTRSSLRSPTPARPCVAMALLWCLRRTRLEAMHGSHLSSRPF